MKGEPLSLWLCQRMLLRIHLAATRFKSHDAPLSRKPQRPLILDDTHHIVVGYVEVHIGKAVSSGIIATQPIKGSHPEFACLINQAAVHLIVGQRLLISIFVFVLFQFLSGYMVFPQAITLG